MAVKLSLIMLIDCFSTVFTSKDLRLWIGERCLPLWSDQRFDWKEGSD